MSLSVTCGGQLSVYISEPLLPESSEVCAFVLWFWQHLAHCAWKQWTHCRTKTPTTQPIPHCSTDVSANDEMQWNLSIEDTFGTQLAVLYLEVSLIQR